MTKRAWLVPTFSAGAIAIAAWAARPAAAQDAPPIHAPPFPSAQPQDPPPAPPPPAQTPPYPGPPYPQQQPYPAQPYPPPYAQPYPQQHPYPQQQPYPAQPYPPPYAQPGPAAPPPPAPPPDPADVYHPSLKMEAGAALRKVDDFGFFGMDLRASVGKQNEHLGHYGVFAFQWGETGEHLRTYTLKLGYNLDGRIDILRIGFGIEGGYLFMRRASVDTRMYAFGAGAFGHASVDLVKLGREGRDAMYLDVRVEGALHFEDIAYWGPSVMLGFRF